MVLVGVSLRVNVVEILLVIFIAIVVSVSIGVALFGVLGIIPRINLLVILAAILTMVSISVSATLIFYFTFRRYASERAVKVAMMTLSEDEQKVLQQVMALGSEVRQDDLWRHLDLSKSKLSALVINLERKGAITRARYHRTNILKLTEEFSKR